MVDTYDVLMLGSIAERLGRDKKLVLLHGNADPDAVGCGYAIYRSFPDVTVAALGGLDRVSKVVASNLDFKVEETANISDFQLIIAVDSSSPDQIGIDISAQEHIVIDHHADNGSWDRASLFCDDSKRSCAEIVYELLKIAGKDIDRNVGLALAAGMLTDSGHFRFANPALMRTFAEVIERSTINIDEVMDLTDLEPDVSERVSQLKGVQRLRFERIGDMIVAISMGSAHESSVCKAILSAGADVVFVGSQRDEKFRVSSRARQDVVRSGLHLGRILDMVGGETSSSGGGHPGAAGLTGVGDVEAILNMCMERTLDVFRTMKDIP